MTDTQTERMTEAQMSEWRALLAGATPGPWTRVDKRGLTILGDCGSTGMVKRKVPICGMFPCQGTSTQDEKDAALIAECPTIIDALLCEVARLRLIRDAAQPLLDKLLNFREMEPDADNITEILWDSFGVFFVETETYELQKAIALEAKKREG